MDRLICLSFPSLAIILLAQLALCSVMHVLKEEFEELIQC